MTSVAWYWLGFVSVVLLVLANRILNRKGGERFLKAKVVINKINWFLGLLFLAVFLFGIPYGGFLFNTLE